MTRNHDNEIRKTIESVMTDKAVHMEFQVATYVELMKKIDADIRDNSHLSIVTRLAYNLDIFTYEKNERILRKVIDANREFYRTDNIPEEQMPEEGTIITVIPDMEIERLIWKAWRLQNKFMEEVLGEFSWK